MAFPVTHKYTHLKLNNNKMNQLHNLQFDTTRGIVISTRGVELDIKEHRQWEFVNYESYSSR